MYISTCSLVALFIALASTSVRAQMADRLTERPAPPIGSAGDDAVTVTRNTKAAALEAQYEQCRRILTPSQLSHLQQQNGQPATAPANPGNGLG